eukprot:TRINITY_DN64534_c0_g1_i1.p1 TRINITY_DN64534_c0_g1~~TRINITY_DN64534_c0_g1_i1.p1  ORF type:complete len:471 (-),score=126.99 TRINITY_DN64534_c0_g1_i1:56-1468(-)
MSSFDDFVPQANQLSQIMDGPAKIKQSFLKGLWDASEGGDPSGRCDRAINLLVGELEKGSVPAAGNDDVEVKAPAPPPKVEFSKKEQPKVDSNSGFSDFVQQGTQLSSIMDGPTSIQTAFMKGLWDASEGGDPSARVERAINMLLAELEKGTVPKGDPNTGGGGQPEKKKEPSRRKSDKQEDLPRKASSGRDLLSAAWGEEPALPSKADSGRDLLAAAWGGFGGSEAAWPQQSAFPQQPQQTMQAFQQPLQQQFQQPPFQQQQNGFQQQGFQQPPQQQFQKPFEQQQQDGFHQPQQHFQQQQNGFQQHGAQQPFQQQQNGFQQSPQQQFRQQPFQQQQPGAQLPQQQLQQQQHAFQQPQQFPQQPFQQQQNGFHQPFQQIQQQNGFQQTSSQYNTEPSQVLNQQSHFQQNMQQIPKVGSEGYNPFKGLAAKAQEQERHRRDEQLQMLMQKRQALASTLLQRRPDLQGSIR